MIVRPAPVDAVVRGPTGRLEINADRMLVQSWVQGTTGNERVSMAANGQATDTIAVTQEDELSGDALFTQFTSDHQGPYRVEIERGGSQPAAFMNNPVRVEFVTGFSDFPLYFPTPIYVESASNLRIRFTNLAASTTNRVRFKAHGERYFTTSRERLQRLRVERFDPRQRPFWLTLDDVSASLTANQANQNFLMTVPSDGDFEAEFLWVRATGPFSISIATNQGGRPIMNGGGRSTVLVYDEAFGGGVYPYRFPAGTAFFQRQSVLSVTLTNLMANVANVVEVCLVGRLLDYPRGNLPPISAPAPTAAVLAFEEANGRPVAPVFYDFLGGRRR